MADKTAKVHFTNGKVKLIEDWSSLKVEATFVMFVFTEMAGSRLRTNRSIIIPFNQVKSIEVMT
jgi:hypothetical protein